MTDMPDTIFFMMLVASFPKGKKNEKGESSIHPFHHRQAAKLPDGVIAMTTL